MLLFQRTSSKKKSFFLEKSSLFWFLFKTNSQIPIFFKRWFLKKKSVWFLKTNSGAAAAFFERKDHNIVHAFVFVFFYFFMCACVWYVNVSLFLGIFTLPLLPPSLIHSRPPALNPSIHSTWHAFVSVYVWDKLCMIQTNTWLHSTALVPSLKNLLSSYPIGVIHISTSFQTLENKARATGPSKSKQLIILLLHTGTKTSCHISRGWRACPAHAHLRFERSHALLARAGCARWTCDDINAHTLKVQNTNLCVRPMHTRASECPTQSMCTRHVDHKDSDKLKHKSGCKNHISDLGLRV